MPETEAPAPPTEALAAIPTEALLAALASRQLTGGHIEFLHGLTATPTETPPPLLVVDAEEIVTPFDRIQSMALLLWTMELYRGETNDNESVFLLWAKRGESSSDGGQHTDGIMGKILNLVNRDSLHPAISRESVGYWANQINQRYPGVIVMEEQRGEQGNFIAVYQYRIPKAIKNLMGRDPNEPAIIEQTLGSLSKENAPALMRQQIQACSRARDAVSR